MCCYGWHSCYIDNVYLTTRINEPLLSDEYLDCVTLGARCYYCGCTKNCPMTAECRRNQIGDNPQRKHAVGASVT